MTHLTPSVSNVVSHNVQNGTVKAATTAPNRTTRKTTAAGLPAAQGLYDPRNEHDACGVGFIAHMKGKKSHQVVENGLKMLENLTHRGAVGADPLMVMQNLVIVHGKPTWSSQFLIATVNTCGRFTALRYEFFGEPNTDEWGCRAYAIEKSSGEKLVGTDITISIAKTEGWYGKNGSKWKTIPQQMLMYRAGAWWARSYAA